MKKLYIFALVLILIFSASCSEIGQGSVKPPRVPQSFSAAVETKLDTAKVSADLIKENNCFTFTVHEPDGLSGTVIIICGDDVSVKYGSTELKASSESLPDGFVFGALVKALETFSGETAVRCSYDRETETYEKTAGIFSLTQREDGSVSGVEADGKEYILNDFVTKD